MIVSDARRYVFIEMPRTGSRAVATELLEYYDGREVLWKHATYRDFLRHATDGQASYFAFSAVRNPLDVAVTRYAHLVANKDNRFTDRRQISMRHSLSGRIERRIHQWVVSRNASFEDFLLRWYVLPYDTWTSMDHRDMDLVMRTESLADDFDRALRRIGVAPVRRLPEVNKTPGKSGDFADWYTPKAIRRAAWVFGPYMQEWGYAFPDSWGPIRVPWWSTALHKLVRIPRMIYWKYLRYADYTKGQPPRGAGLGVSR